MTGAPKFVTCHWPPKYRPSRLRNAGPPLLWCIANRLGSDRYSRRSHAGESRSLLLPESSTVHSGRQVLPLLCAGQPASEHGISSALTLILRQYRVSKAEGQHCCHIRVTVSAADTDDPSPLSQLKRYQPSGRHPGSDGCSPVEARKHCLGFVCSNGPGLASKSARHLS